MNNGQRASRWSPGPCCPAHRVPFFDVQITRSPSEPAAAPWAAAVSETRERDNAEVPPRSIHADQELEPEVQGQGREGVLEREDGPEEHLGDDLLPDMEGG